MLGKLRVSGAFFAAAAVILTTIIICVCAASSCGQTLTFEASYYIVCYRVADNSISASSLSSTASSYGGAGYILCCDGSYYVTVSCYYNKNDADTVCASLARRGLNCSVLEAETPEYALRNLSAQQNSKLFLGNLNTLHSLSKVAYECANNLDTGAYNQSQVKDTVASIKSGLKGLLNANQSNCFTSDLNFLIAECEDKEIGYLYSKDMRYLQIAIIDVIINAELS